MRIERKATVNEMLALAASDEIAIFCDAKNKLYFWVQDGGALVIDNDNVYATRSGGNTRWSAIGSSSGGGGFTIATQPEAEAGVDNAKGMTPLRTLQSIIANAPGGGGGYVYSTYAGVGSQDSINFGSDPLAVVVLTNASALDILGIARTFPADNGKELILIAGNNKVTLKFFASATSAHHIVNSSQRDIVLQLGDSARIQYGGAGNNIITGVFVRGKEAFVSIATSNAVNCGVGISRGDSVPKTSNFGDLNYHAEVSVTAPGLVTFELALPNNASGSYSNNQEAGGSGSANDGAEIKSVHVEGVNGTTNALISFYAANAATYTIKARIGYTITG